ncbi:hypothetical protein [Streptomyces sp. SHP 1-2]|uniref:hypothetical protein n=1 Tax=Streptomyces sp. SHP 1-2 TaxID=2769489 RepID=UPI0022389482|nr:hypothetical protein [Streptomyces sp. SHP 1-2]MCW5252207.1 hypothetical protein [Streptomyces sp. SHP 1-2]
MAQDSWPNPEHNNRFVNDVEYEQMARYFTGSGVYGAPTDPAVVTAGVGLTVNIRANVFASVSGHGWTSGTTGDTLTIDPNTSGQARVDRVILRLSRTTWTVRAVIKKGTPGGGPPTLATGPDLPNFEVLLGNITVPAGALSVTVTRGERYVGRGLRVTTSTAQTNPNPELGDLTWESDTKRLRIYDGQKTRTLYEDSGQVVITTTVSGWKAGSDSVLELKNGAVYLRLGSMERTGGGLSGSTSSRLPGLIPAAYRHPTRDQPVLAYITGAGLARLVIYAANTPKPGQIWLENYREIGTGEDVLPEGGVSWVVD